MFSVLARALRIHQWVKNALLFLPLLLAHILDDPLAWGRAAAAFACFSLCASAVYVSNDLWDLEADRQHPRKKNRPFAAGTLSVRTGRLLALVLVLASFALSTGLLPWTFTAVLGAYLLTSVAYSLFLRRLPLIDVIVLAGLYALRIFAGGFAVGIPISQWLIAFSVFFFLNLAFVKRYAELSLLREHAHTQALGRNYTVDDMDLIRSMGVASGFVSVLVLVLYVNSDDVRLLYEHPHVLWLLGPLLLYWISRVWLHAHRGRMHDDPVVFATHDRASYAVAAAVIAVLLASFY